MNQYQSQNRRQRRVNWLGLILLNLFVARFTFILLDRLKNRENRPAYNMRNVAKRYINPWMLKIAGRSTNPQGIITHIGRKSGHTYSTPVTPAPIANGFVIALTYGPNVDWCRNILAAGSCTLQWHGTTYSLVKPQLVEAASIAPSLPPFNQLALRVLKVSHVLKLELSTSPADYATSAL
jgi:deazaflavin-dependent oxidoreductase (nitroreductase family)